MAWEPAVVSRVHVIAETTPDAPAMSTSWVTLNRVASDAMMPAALSEAGVFVPTW
jgi:hypothetical protein